MRRASLRDCLNIPACRSAPETRCFAAEKFKSRGPSRVPECSGVSSILEQDDQE